MEKYLRFAKAIAKHAGKVMKKYFKKDNHSDYKIDNTIVTIADKEINDYLIDQVKKHYPSHSVDGEENGFGTSKYVWVCDPVDGTAMYARHIPVAVFSLALVEDGKPILGVVLDPWTNSLYYAIKGQRAYKNGQPIHVSDIPLDDKRAVVHYDMWNTSEFNVFDIIKKLGKTTYCVSIGSVIRASLCVASGEFVGVVFPGTDHKNCDIAAVKVIVEEAGGVCLDFFGNEQRYDTDITGAVLANKASYEDIAKVVKAQAEKDRK